MAQEFKSVVYLKQNCPFCMKLRIFFLEAGLMDKIEIREVIPGDANEQKYRDELAPNFDKVTLPAAEIMPGIWHKDSDALIERFAEMAAADPGKMPVLQAYIQGPFASLMKLYKENTELKKQIAA